ncbi:MAG: hypothetical protein NTU95_02710 [Methanothrix sp.]|nr:hypothetical protein [Methanothrix sp.]
MILPLSPVALVDPQPMGRAAGRDPYAERAPARIGAVARGCARARSAGGRYPGDAGNLKVE